MKTFATIAVLSVMVGFAASAKAQTDVTNVNSPTNPDGFVVLSGSIFGTLDPANTYLLDGTVTVDAGNTLTVPAGTVVKSNFANESNAPSVDSVLLVNRDAQIFIQGTPDNPVVFTSTNDSPDPNNPTAPLGSRRGANNEWGSIGIAGNARIGSKTDAKGADVIDLEVNGPGAGDADGATNDGIPFQGDFDVKILEGVEVVDTDGDGRNEGPDGVYGGIDDDDDSGEIKYLSIRYAGRFGGTNNSELNGISFGGVGRETEVEGIDIWNNIDDGVEVFGGTVNFKYLNIWNIGDDSFDLDEGWRGKYQFGLHVQGASGVGADGSGVGDNLFEHDGAQPSWAQPVTTALIANVTAIGAPGSGDEGIEFRDGCRIQYRNILLMDVADKVIDEADSEGTTPTGNWRYGDNGSFGIATKIPSFDDSAGDPASIWDLDHAEAWNTANSATGGHPFAGGSQAQLQNLYQAQTPGNASINQGQLAEVTNSIFWAASGSLIPGEADNVGLGDANEEPVMVNGSSGNSFYNNKFATSLPIAELQRLSDLGQPLRSQAGFSIDLVEQLDPRPVLPDAMNSGFEPTPIAKTCDPATYVGGFSPTRNWALGWTAASDYGIFTSPANPSAPATTDIALTTGISFPTDEGVFYKVESSTNGTDFSTEAIVEGTGNTVTVGSTLGGNRVFKVTPQ